MCFAVQLLYFELDAGAAMKNGNEAHFTVVYNRVFSFVLKYVHGYVLRVSAVGVGGEEKCCWCAVSNKKKKENKIKSCFYHKSDL